MEAPDKIYLIRNIPSYTSLNTTNDCHEKYLQEWYKSREKDADVEYIRADVFIRKARKYFIKELPNFRSFMESGTAFIKNFENFMKEE